MKVTLLTRVLLKPERGHCQYLHLFIGLSSHVQWLFGLVSLLFNAKVMFKSYALLMQFRIHVVDAILYTF